MASITINSIVNRVPATASVTGEEKLLIINKDGKTSTIAVNQILDKIDDDIVDRIDDPVIEAVKGQIDEIVNDRLDEIDPDFSLKWHDVQ